MDIPEHDCLKQVIDSKYFLHNSYLLGLEQLLKPLVVLQFLLDQLLFPMQILMVVRLMVLL